MDYLCPVQSLPLVAGDTDNHVQGLLRDGPRFSPGLFKLIEHILSIHQLGIWTHEKQLELPQSHTHAKTMNGRQRLFAASHGESCNIRYQFKNIRNPLLGLRLHIRGRLVSLENNPGSARRTVDDLLLVLDGSTARTPVRSAAITRCTSLDAVGLANFG